MAFDKRGGRRPAADRLESQGPGAGEQIEGLLADNGRANQVEDGLADAILHRPRAIVAVVEERFPAQLAADDARRRGRSGGSGRPARRTSGRAASGHGEGSLHESDRTWRRGRRLAATLRFYQREPV